MTATEQWIADLRALRMSRVLITGADGMLGRAFGETLQRCSPGTRVFAYAHELLDVTDHEQVMRLASESPDLIIHCAGLSNADQCERDPTLAHQVHVQGTRNVIALARQVSARVFYPQSVFIFDGSELPVCETTRPRPPFVYGRVKHRAELDILADVPDSLVVRMAGFFGGDAKDKNFVGSFTRTLERMLANGETTVAVGERAWQPTYTLDLASNTLLLLSRGCSGVYHMGGEGEATFFDVAQACVHELGLTKRISVHVAPAAAFSENEPARRPMRMVTRNDRLRAEGLDRQRPWSVALREYLQRPYFDRLRVAASR
jgi:dTDP-4-dehydrorhamnose reductase